MGRAIVRSLVCIHGVQRYKFTFTLYFVIKYPILKIKKNKISEDVSCTTEAALRLIAR